MKMQGLKRVLSLLLVISLLAGLAVPAHSAGAENTVTFKQVDNSMVSVNPLQRPETEIDEAEPYVDTDMVRVSIVLEKASTLRSGFSTADIASNKAASAYRESLKKDQADMVARIEKATKMDLDVVWNLTLAANLISANVPYGQIEAIRNIRGVKNVFIENQYLAEPVENDKVAPNMATSGGQTGSILAWAAGYTGAGTRIAVIDTGTDTDHQSLNAEAFNYSLAKLAEQKGLSTEAYIESLDLLDAAEIAAVAEKLNVKVDPEAAYFNAKLPFGYNYKDSDYDITHDNDEEGEHGSHVAGIATANAWIAKDGSFVKAMEEVYMQGVAPDAQLLTMKVFGKGGSPYDSDYMVAIEDAVILGCDAVNLSLGSVAPGRGTHANPEFEQIMTDLTKSGVVVTISAGNSGPWAENAENGGYLYATDVTLDTVGQPGSFTNSFAVASVENDGMIGYYVSVEGEMIVYNENLFNDMRPFTAIAGEHEYIFIDGVGKAEDWEAVADVLPGKIAICSRGETNFLEKATLAVDAGAIAVLIYNNTSGMINLDLTEFMYTAPVAAISQVQGATIRAKSTPVTDDSGNVRYFTGKMTVSDSIGLGQFDSEYYTMSSFSSWGVPGSLELKPEITAPGGNIYSLNGLDTSGKGYEIMSGTSMASPQVAGMSALMAQFVRENNLTEKTGLTERQIIQSLLMSTATPVQVSEGVYYPVLQQGAGLANVSDAMAADSWITMAPGSSSGYADGKIKVELFDDPERTGSYSATFTVNNLTDEEKTLNLNADFFTQAMISDGEHNYMDYATAALGMDVIWTVNGTRARNVQLAEPDFNGDGVVNTADGQALLDYATGVKTTLNNMDKADVDGDGDVDSHDAYVFLRSLSTTVATLPASGSVNITVRFSLTESARATLEEEFPNGNYIQGFLYAQVVGGTSHSIPVFGFYGNWTDPGMFDVGQWTTFATGEDTRIPYIGRTRGNDFKVVYEWDPGYNYSFGGNPIIADSKYMPERNAMNANDTMDGVSFIAIRHADQSRVVINNETTGKNIMDVKTGAVNMAYYYGALGWQNSGATLTTNFSLKDTTEGDHISMAFTLVPEYYVDDKGEVDWDALGTGASLSTSFVIDNTAPEIFGVSIDIMTNSMTVKASDNEYIAGVGLYNKTGTRCLAQTGAKQDIQKGETAEYSFSLDKVNGKKFLLQVFDYAMNRSTYLIEMQIGESTDLPEMMAFDLVSRHWAGFDKTFEYDYKVGTPRVAYADHVYYAATIAEHYVFASTNKGELYVMPEDDLSDITLIVDMEMVLYDMAYNTVDGEIYGVTEKGELVRIHKLSGDVTRLGKIGVTTNTLACDYEGNFYCNELATGKVYSFTLDTMDAPVLLMEDPFLTYVDPIAGADMGGTTGNMGMEFNPNTGMICWNSHCEVLVGSYITYAYYYEIDPATGEFTRYNDFWHEMSGLIIPVRSGNDGGWADPTDKVMAVKLNKSEIDVIRNTSAQLIANVQPWTATDRTVTWSSADETIATVNKYGVVTGIKEGTTTIRATSNLDPSKYAECTVNVEVLNVTLHGTVQDENGNPMFYSWDMSKNDGWTAGNALDIPMTSATWSTLEKVYYIMDSDPEAFMMHKVDADGKTLASAENTNGIPLWDMAYSQYFTELRGVEQVSSIYYYYLLSPKDPMNMDAVGFNLGDLATYLVGITSAGYEKVADEDGNLHETEHLILLDNDGYVWDFWIYDREGGGMDALYNITKSNLNCEFPGDDTMDNMYTSLMVGEDGNLYLSAFEGSTNEIYHLSYDADIDQYVAVMIGTMGADVWPATITSVTTNNGSTGAAVSPAPTATMSAEVITRDELAAASQKAAFTVSQAERDTKLSVYATGTMDDPHQLLVGDNTIPSAKGSYGYAKFVADSEGTATVTIAGTDWRYAFYHYDATGKQLNYFSNNSKNCPYGGVLSANLKAGEYILLGITPYVSYTMPEGSVDVNLAFTGENATDPTDPEPTDPGEPDPSEPTEPATGDTLVLGQNSVASGTVYTYTATADGRLEFDFSNMKDGEGKTIYQYAYGKADRVKIMINGQYAANLLDTRVTVSKGATVTVELVSVDGGSYTATLTLGTLASATKLVLGDNSIAINTDYSFIAQQAGTLYTTIKELWCDGTYCSEASLSSSVVFKINGTAVYGFNNSYEVKSGDEITVRLGTQFGDPANAVLNLSFDGFYEHPLGSRGNPYTLTYAECPTQSAKIEADTAVWYKLSGFGSGYNLVVTGENAYVEVSGTRVNATNGTVTVPAYSSLQIGNAGTTAATFTLSASITEGYPDNPKDLAEGENTAVLGKSGNFYYDFVATRGGTATFTVSGDNWRFWYSYMDAKGNMIVTEDDHRQIRDDAATVTVEMKTGETIIVKLGTMTSSWTAPGGELTVNFHFEPDGTEPEPTEPEPTEPEPTEPEPTEPEPTEPEPTEPEPTEPVTGTPLTLGVNNLTSGTVYVYTPDADGRLEFDFSNLKDSEGKTIYQYAYGKADRVKIMINGNHAVNLLDTKVTVTSGRTVTVELVPVDGDTYTATLNLSALAAAKKLVLGDNAISKDTDYSFIAQQNGTLYTTIKELWCDGTYCSELSLSSSVVFRINGKTVSSFRNSYEVKTGDEITVLLGTQFGEPASAVLNLSYEGFYEHPIGSRGNPYYLSYAECPTQSVKIGAGAAVWYKLSGFGSGYSLVVTGENAYVVVGGVRVNPTNGVIVVPAYSSLQIGNAGTSAATFGLSATIAEGYPDNPKDLVEGKNTVTLDKSDNYYFDFVAPQKGTATFTVSGDNWRFWYSYIDAKGNVIVNEEDHRQARDDADTVTVEMKADETIVVKLSTMTSSWTAPGGVITVDFHFEADGTAPEPTEPEPTEPLPEPENPLVLGKNTLESAIEYTYDVPADGRMEFTVNSVKNSAGSKLYSWTNGKNVLIEIDGVAMTASTKRMNVTAGQRITVQVLPVDEDTYTVELTLKELEPAVALTLGENNIAQNLEHLYVAEKDGTLYLSVVEMLYNGKAATESDLGSTIQLTINGASVSTFNKSLEVKTGDEVAVIIKDYSWDGSGVVTAVMNLSYDGFYEHPAGSIANPVDLLYADCPTKTIEIAAGGAAWYELESYYDESAWSTVYPFEDKYFVVTGENAWVDVDGTRYDAENGTVKVLMDDSTLIQIGNGGTAAAIFDLSVEIPEGHVDNPQDLAEGDNKVTLPSYGSHYFDFTASVDGTVTTVVSGENWKYNFTHFDAQGNQISTKDYYAKNGDTDTVTLEMTAGQRIVIMVGTSKGYSQPGGDITVNFHFEPAQASCQHTNTEVRDAKEATCTEDGYTGDTWCLDCETMILEGTVITAPGHNYEDGSCTNCGETDPDYKPDNTVVVEVTHEELATNGVVTVTWDPAKMQLTDIVIYADYTSILEGEGFVTFGYVSLNGIPAGKTVAKLTFEAVDAKDAEVTVEVEELNNNKPAVVNPFVDVEEDDYFFDPVMWAVSEGITNGVDATHFGPKQECNRAQIVTFLWRAAGSPEPTTTQNPFTDVDSDDYYYKAVLWAVEEGITNGISATMFGPKQICSRAQIVTFLWRAAGSPEPATTQNPFADVDSDDYYYKAVLWAVEEGVTNGMNATTFGSKLNCTRAQAITFLYRVYA